MHKACVHAYYTMHVRSYVTYGQSVSRNRAHTMTQVFLRPAMFRQVSGENSHFRYPAILSKKDY